MGSDVEVLRLGMMHDQGARGLLGVDLPVLAQTAPDAGGIDQVEQLLLSLISRQPGIRTVATAPILR